MPARTSPMSERSTSDNPGQAVDSATASDRSELASLFPLVYEGLSQLAHQQRITWHGDLTLNTTALVHELFLKLAEQGQATSESRAHFYGVAGKAIRHILCNYARDRRRLKRGGDAPHESLGPRHDLALPISEADEDRLAALDEALRELEHIAERQARVIECRFFAGMSIEDTADALGISPRTVKREWTFARAWLRHRVSSHLD